MCVCVCVLVCNCCAQLYSTHWKNMTLLSLFSLYFPLIKSIVLQEKKHVKKHLFSDTDTDYATTEVSWLRESSRKPKPKVTKYSRQAPIKPKAESPQTSCKLLDSCLYSETRPFRLDVDQIKWRNQYLHKEDVLSFWAGESSHLPPPSPKPVKVNTKTNNVRQCFFYVNNLL